MTPDEIARFPLVRAGRSAKQGKAGGAEQAAAEEEEEESCAVCLEAFRKKERARELPCKHRFHSLCIGKWFKEHIVCPLCRYDCRAMQPSA